MMADVALKHPVAVSSFHQHLSAARRLSSSKFWFCRPWDSIGSSSDSFTAPKFTSWKQTQWNYFQKVVCHSSLNWQYKDLLDRQCCIFRGKIVQFFSLHWLSPHIHQPFKLCYHPVKNSIFTLWRTNRSAALSLSQKLVTHMHEQLRATLCTNWKTLSNWDCISTCETMWFARDSNLEKTGKITHKNPRKIQCTDKVSFSLCDSF